MTMYDKFSSLLKLNNVTPYRIHKETGISTATLSDWKNGKSEPKKDKIQKICDYFGVPISYFYGDDGTEQENNSDDDYDVAKDIDKLIVHLKKSKESSRLMYNGVELLDIEVDLFQRDLVAAIDRLREYNRLINSQKNEENSDN